jgi:hypothetical protein
MSTNTETETETKTNTCTRTQGACAMGAGAAAITCKGMFLGFLGGGLAVIGLSGTTQLALTLLAVVGGAILAWYGFRWAGRKPVVMAIGGLATMWIGYAVSGGLTTGNWLGAEFGSEVWVANPVKMAPVAALYIIGTGLIAGAAYLSFGKQYKASKGSVGAGVAGASVCGGCGITGLAGGLGVAALGASQGAGMLVAMTIAAVIVLGYTLYQRAWIQSAVVAVGAFIAVPIPYYIVSFPSTPFYDMFGMLITYGGLAIAFFGLFWAYNPEMSVLPEKWSPLARVRETS